MGWGKRADKVARKTRQVADDYAVERKILQKKVKESKAEEKRLNKVAKRIEKQRGK